MNALEVAQRAAAYSGDDTRYDADDFTSVEGIRLLARLNDAYRAIASHKFPRIGLIPFRGLEREADFTSKYVTGTVTAVTDADTFTLSVTPATYDILTVNGKTVEVVAVAGNEVTVSPALSAAPSVADSIILRRNRYDLVTDVGATARSVLEILDIYDLDHATELFRAGTTDYFDNYGLTLGTPYEYLRFGTTTIKFVQTPESATRYRVRYAAYPDALVNTTDELVLPEAFHIAVALRMAWDIALEQQDTQTAYILRQTYKDELTSLQNEYETYYDKEAGRVIVR